VLRFHERTQIFTFVRCAMQHYSKMTTILKCPTPLLRSISNLPTTPVHALHLIVGVSHRVRRASLSFRFVPYAHTFRFVSLRYIVGVFYQVRRTSFSSAFSVLVFFFLTHSYSCVFSNQTLSPTHAHTRTHARAHMRSFLTRCVRKLLP
jgi:hypothetical protein